MTTTGVMGGELGDIFWDLAPWIVYTPGFDIGCNIYVANPTDTAKEYALIAGLFRNDTLISEEALPVYGSTWFTVEPGDFLRLRGALRFDESDVVLSVGLVERETEMVADLVSTSLVAPTVSALPPTWPGMPDVTGEAGYDWSLLLTMMLPVMMLGIIASAVRSPAGKEKVTLPAGEERKMLPAGREA
ncbi:MAG TPA: hypothetical protein G4O10_08670 [Dehalococcoidia bacterium]|nr:hypothetical protein [Dehalococcoidia bacterium]